MQRTFWRHISAALCGGLLLGASACKDTVAPPTAASIAAVGSPSITAIVGDVQTIRILVVDANGKPFVGGAVTFNVVDGGGSIVPASTLTSASGEAAATWTLGSTTGIQRAQAQVAGLTGAVSFVATALPAAPASVAVSAGDNQTATSGSTLPTQPAVVVKDKFGNPVQGISVFFTVTAGGGSVAASGSTTSAAGIATANGWKLGTTAGPNRLTALALTNGATGNPVVFTANAVAGAAVSVSANSSASLVGTVGTAVSPLPSVRVTDAGGNPVSGAQVTFTASSGATISGAIKLTDANGLATVDGWTLGSAARNYAVTATSGALTPVVFTAAAQPGAPAIVTVNAGAGQSAVVGRPVAIEPSVTVTDGFQNPVPGVEVVYDVTAGGGSATGRRPITNASGVAQVGGWVLGDNLGSNTLSATVTSTTSIANNPISFVATATAGPPTSLVFTTGSGQSGIVGSVIATPPSVTVRDARNNPVSGAAVTFLTATGSGSVTGANATTNANGVATVGSWTLGLSVGAQTLIARVAGVPDASITATGLAVTPASVVALTATDLGTVPISAVATPAPSVKVLDASGNPVFGSTVTFTPEAGQSSILTGAVQVTAADGIATLGSWNVGTLAGVTLRVRAFVTGLNLNGAEPVFTVRTGSGSPSIMNLAPGAQKSQPGVASTAVGILPSVRVTDVSGNPIAGLQVNFVESGGVVTGAAQFTDANGVAQVGSWVLPAGTNVTHTMTAYLSVNATIQFPFSVVVP